MKEENYEFSLIPTGSNPNASIQNSIERLNQPLADFLTFCDLPTDNILSPVDERRKVIYSLQSVLEILPIDARQRAHYISKFTISVAVGLFDGALSFLWDETIKVLREKIISYDLEYFYSVAESISSRYKGLSGENEIEAVGEHDLLEISRRMGLIDDLSYKRLEYINYFRNHASSAHPNEHELSGVELLGFLENCLRYAICTEPDVPAIQVKRLRENVRTQVIEAEDYEAINDEICKLPIERIEDLLRTFFGMYCDPKQDQTALANIKGLAPFIWKVVGDDLKLKIGSKFGAYRANGDTERKARANDFLGAVGGNSYKDEDSLSSELIEKLQELRIAHNSTNNFYNEYSYALSIKQSLPKSGIPDAARKDFVKVVSVCYMGNGCGYREGVDERAVVLYSEFIDRFTNKEIRIFLGLFNDPEFLRDMHSRKVKQRAKSLIEILDSKTSDVRIKNALGVLLKASALEKVGMVSEYKNAINGIA